MARDTSRQISFLFFRGSSSFDAHNDSADAPVEITVTGIKFRGLQNRQDNLNANTFISFPETCKKAPLCFRTTYKEDRNSVEKLEPDYKSSIIHSYASCYFSQFFSVKPSAHRSL